MVFLPNCFETRLMALSGNAPEHIVRIERQIINSWGKHSHLHKESNNFSLLVVSIRYRCGKQQEVLIGCGRGVLTVREIKVVTSQTFFSPSETVLLETTKWQSQVYADFPFISHCYIKSSRVVFSVSPLSPKCTLNSTEYLLLDYALSCIFPPAPLRDEDQLYHIPDG